MTIDYKNAMSLTSHQLFSWTERDAILYALGTGMPENPLDERELSYLRDGVSRVLPTFPVAIAFAGGPLSQAGLTRAQVLHGEHAVTLHRSIPAAGAVMAEGRMVDIWDKGPDKGAVLSQVKHLTLEESGEPLASIYTTVVARADGGFGGPRTGQPAPYQMPDRAPDHVIDMTTTPSQALLYRLSGDPNPLHIEPEVARTAGFERPILHGLCTFAICCRAILKVYCDYDSSKITHHQLRFSGPVYPGDTIRVRLWRDHEIVSFEADVPSRGAPVVKGGKCLIVP